MATMLTIVLYNQVDKKIDYNMNSRTSGETAHDSLGSGSDSGSAQHDDGSSTATAASSTSSSGSSDGMVHLYE